jgi:predicted unusual protein kinase regulating ubiquinone biosynthesis (AarF/ABC1/UbiB family)
LGILFGKERHLADDSNTIPSGRLARFARLASLTARTAGDLAVGAAKRKLGEADDWSQERRAAAKVLETLGTMKGAAMKLGQQLAMEADALPPEARDIVSRLFQQAPPMPYEAIARVVEEELGEPPDASYASFSREPIASASLGQVHRAVLKDGTPVAVKVQYPGVAEALESDLRNAGLLTKAFPAGMFKGLDTAHYFEEIRREIGAETDYVREGRLAETFAAAVAGVDELHVPRPFPAYSSSRVLTLEYVEGVSLKAFAASDAGPEARWRVGRQLALAILVPFVRRGLVHGDPHPGNFLVRPDGRMTVLDFGAIKQLTPAFVGGFWGLMEAEVEGRTADYVGLLEGAGFTYKGDLSRASETLRALNGIAARPIRAARYDWGACTMVVDMRRQFVTEFKDILEVQPPPESLLFYRALGGLVSNLKLLRTEGPYREVCVELCEMRRQAAAARPEGV